MGPAWLGSTPCLSVLSADHVTPHPGLVTPDPGLVTPPPWPRDPSPWPCQFCLFRGVQVTAESRGSGWVGWPRCRSQHFWSLVDGCPLWAPGLKRQASTLSCPGWGGLFALRSICRPRPMCWGPLSVSLGTWLRWALPCQDHLALLPWATLLVTLAGGFPALNWMAVLVFVVNIRAWPRADAPEGVMGPPTLRGSKKR